MNSASQYRYDHVTPDVLRQDMAFGEGAPEPGDRLPDFDLPTTDGGRIRSADFPGTKPLLLVTGSYSCPMTASANPFLKDCHEEFGRDIEFVMLYVREAHPGEHHEQPRSFEEKLARARALKERDRLPWPVAVDDPEGTVHRALDGKPNAVFLTNRDGIIVYRGLWAGDERGLVPALDAVLRGAFPHRQESQRRLGPMAMGVGKMREMAREAGPRAERDLWYAAPPVAAMAWLADLYRPLPPKWRTIAAAATVGVAVSALVSAAGRRRRR